MIKEFQEENRYLSNFFIEPDGTCVEKEFQAAKVDKDKVAYYDDNNKPVYWYDLVMNAKSPGAAKRLGKKVPLKYNWEIIKLDVMYHFVKQKFIDHKMLRTKLLSTGNEELQEGNLWHDIFWGIDLETGRGENHLGKILMQVREELCGN